MELYALTIRTLCMLIIFLIGYSTVVFGNIDNYFAKRTGVDHLLENNWHTSVDIASNRNGRLECLRLCIKHQQCMRYVTYICFIYLTHYVI